MKHAKIYSAYPILTRLKKLVLPSTVTYDLFRLERELRSIYEFLTEEHQKLFDEYQPQYDQENNKLIFKSVEECEKFVKQADALDELDYEIKSIKEPVRIALTPKFSLSVEEMDALEGLIVFYRPPEPEAESEELQPSLEVNVNA